MGEHGGGTLYRERREKGEISFYQEIFLGGGLQEMCKRRLWKWASLSIVALLGDLQGGTFTGDCERLMKGRLLSGGPEGYIKDSSRDGHLCP